MLDLRELDILRETGERLLVSDLYGPPAARAWRAKVVGWLQKNQPGSNFAAHAALVPNPREPLNPDSGRGLQSRDKSGVRQLLKILLKVRTLTTSEQKAPGLLEESKPLATQSDRLIFISHSSADADLSDSLVDMLCTALQLRRRDFRCTSVAGSKLPGGADTAATLRADIHQVPIFFSILTPAALASHYVLFELGARWGVDAFHIPLLARGAGPNVIREPLKDLNCLRLTERIDVLQLIEDVGARLHRKPERADEYHEKVELVVRLARRQTHVVTRETPTSAKEKGSKRLVPTGSSTAPATPRTARASNVPAMEISRTIKAAPLMSQAAVAQQFLGQLVEWNMYLQQIIPMPGDSMRLRFAPSATDLFPQILCEVDGSNLASLSGAHQGSLMRVQGKLDAASDIELHLTDAKLEQLAP